MAHIDVAKIKLLQRYRIDRGTGGTRDGATQLVILVLKASDAPELAYAISKADALLIGHALCLAATEAQEAMNG